MKPSARAASIFIFLFFLSFNGLQVYLIVERISEAKNKFGSEAMMALGSTLNEYNKLKAVDSASRPSHAWIAYGIHKIWMTRPDSQTVTFSVPYSSLHTDTVQTAIIEGILNSTISKAIDLASIDSLFKKTLQSKRITAEYILDSVTMPGRKFNRQFIQQSWEHKKRRGYFYSTMPMRVPYNANSFLFAELKYDSRFMIHDLLWPLLSFALILLIGNTALLFVYKTIRKQKKINELKTDFINNMTHEMKTPITIASAGLDALEHHITPTERTRFYLHTTKKQLHLLDEYIERILDAAVQDISEFTLRKEKIDLKALFGELASGHSLTNQKPVSFVITGKGSAFIQGDRLHLETAFHNIIDNSIKYSNTSVEINIDITDNSSECIIRIRDNGMGIPPQYTKNIFDKFFRVPQGDANAVKGFGLGLHYVNHIVRKHGGQVSVQSRLHEGTEFIITLPKNA